MRRLAAPRHTSRDHEGFRALRRPESFMITEPGTEGRCRVWTWRFWRDPTEPFLVLFMNLTIVAPLTSKLPFSNPCYRSVTSCFPGRRPMALRRTAALSAVLAAAVAGTLLTTATVSASAAPAAVRPAAASTTGFKAIDLTASDGV